MAKPLFDADALITMFANATAAQGEQVRKTVHETTLAALQARELSLKNIRGALQQVADAAAQGAAKNVVAGADVPGLLDKAVSGMDQALLRAVEANRTALGMLAKQGADLQQGALGKAVAELEKFEDTLLGVVKKAAASVPAMPGAADGGPFAAVLEKLQAGGTLSGAGAAKSVEQLMDQMHSAVRASRASGLRAAQAMAEGYTAMVSGVLIGMSEALSGGVSKGGGAKKSGR